ncbi:hypothetical protein AC579_4233 [Pseudocercospora musae]|uniref:Uncharacterized protein n=1 Tax=Pseudocercospora musae TaxID=113226 RepID=A0A139ID15_9PEZI|nr:hypothetical protein AC579_4233 [Pseudocercospora musae]
MLGQPRVFEHGRTPPKSERAFDGDVKSVEMRITSLPTQKPGKRLPRKTTSVKVPADSMATNSDPARRQTLLLRNRPRQQAYPVAAPGEESDDGITEPDVAADAEGEHKRAAHDTFTLSATSDQMLDN